MEDAIVSASKFLHKKSSWDTLLEWNKIPNMIEVEAAWYEWEFTHEDASFVYETSKSGKTYACFTKERPELEYVKSYTKKIMRYNNSSNYSVGVMRLAYDAHKLLKDN